MLFCCIPCIHLLITAYEKIVDNLQIVTVEESETNVVRGIY